jgi:nitroreductase
MDALDAIRSRRSVKHYDAEHRMSDEDVTTLFDLALCSPTAFNLQHWRFLLVKDPELRGKIRELSWNQAQVTDASLLIVLCANLSAWKDAARCWRDAPEPVQGFMLPAIANYYDGNPQVQRDEALRSCGIAAQTLMIAAKGMGYDTCPMDGFDFDAVGKLINLPDDHLISMFVVVGKAAEEAHGRPGQLDASEVVLTDRF